MQTDKSEAGAATQKKGRLSLVLPRAPLVSLVLYIHTHSFETEISLALSRDNEALIAHCTELYTATIKKEKDEKKKKFIELRNVLLAHNQSSQ